MFQFYFLNMKGKQTTTLHKTWSFNSWTLKLQRQLTKAVEVGTKMQAVLLWANVLGLEGHVLLIGLTWNCLFFTGSPEVLPFSNGSAQRACFFWFAYSTGCMSFLPMYCRPMRSTHETKQNHLKKRKCSDT